MIPIITDTYAEETVTGALEALPDGWSVVPGCAEPAPGRSKAFVAHVQRPGGDVATTAWDWQDPKAAVLAACARVASEVEDIRRVELITAPLAGRVLDAPAMRLLRHEILELLGERRHD